MFQISQEVYKLIAEKQYNSAIRLFLYQTSGCYIGKYSAKIDKQVYSAQKLIAESKECKDAWKNHDDFVIANRDKYQQGSKEYWEFGQKVWEIQDSIRKKFNTGDLGKRLRKAKKAKWLIRELRKQGKIIL